MFPSGSAGFRAHHRTKKRCTLSRVDLNSRCKVELVAELFAWWASGDHRRRRVEGSPVIPPGTKETLSGSPRRTGRLEKSPFLSRRI